MNDALMEMKFSVMQNDTKITLNLDYVTIKSIYKPEEYSQLRRDFQQLVNAGNEKLVLVKK